MVRTGHLEYRENYIDCANELWSGSNNQFTSDSSSTVFMSGYLWKTSGGYVGWGENVGTDFNANPSYNNPLSESHYISGNSYKFITWI